MPFNNIRYDKLFCGYSKTNNIFTVIAKIKIDVNFQ